MVTPSSRLCRQHRHLLCRRLHLPPRLLPRLVLLEGRRPQLPSDQKGLSRGILDVFCSYPIVVLVAIGGGATMGDALRGSKLSCGL